MVALMSSLGAPLIPTIAAADHVSLPAAQWLLTAALLAGALVTPVMGRLADRPHQRQAVLIALAVVVLGVGASGRAIATLPVTGGARLALGYPVTSIISEAFGYWAAFWFGALAVALALALVVVAVPPPAGAPAGGFDVLGACLLSLAVVGLMAVLSEGGQGAGRHPSPWV